MSREFGEYIGGYFHDKINHAMDDLKHSSHIELHKKLIPFFKSLHKIAYEISNVEAGDSGEDASINAMKKEIPIMITELKKLQNTLEMC
jgi:hypothetical protein